MTTELKERKRLSFRDRLLFLRALILIQFIHLYLKASGFKSTLRFLNRFLPEGNISEPNATEIERYHRLIVLIYRLPSMLSNCLAVSLSFWFIMKKRGILTDLRFGMKNDKNGIKAHAWLEYKGFSLTVNNNITGEYTPFSEPVL